MDLFSLWEDLVTYIKSNDSEYSEMFELHLYPVSLSGSVLTISTDHTLPKYQVAWLANVYSRKLESYILKTKNQQITIQVDNYRPPKITPNDGPGPVSAHASAKDMEREKARNVVPPAPSPAPFPEGGIPSPFPEGNEPAPVMESKAADPFPEEAAPPDFTNLKPKSADEVALPSIQDVAQGSLFEEPKKPEAKKAKVFQSNPINEDYTFETFVHGGCNDVAYSAALAVAQAAVNPKLTDTNMNPLFIYGPSGLGKTHLLHAICNYIHEYKPELSVLFVSSETFTNELIDAIQRHATNDFRQKYRNPDFLLIDDVQFFGSRDSTKMEIFNTFNELFDKKKNIIMTSDRTPSDIEKLEDRLQSRFSSGLVAPISPPDYEICSIILKNRAEKQGINLPDEVVDYIASHINTNVRELEGAFNSLVMIARIKEKPITLPFAMEALKDKIPLDGGNTLTVDIIIDKVCDRYGVTKEQVLSNARPKKYVVPRQISMYLARNLIPGISFPALRDKFKRKDHTTVVYACERVEKEIKRDQSTKAVIDELTKQLKR